MDEKLIINRIERLEKEIEQMKEMVKKADEFVKNEEYKKYMINHEAISNYVTKRGGIL